MGHLPCDGHVYFNLIAFVVAAQVSQVREYLGRGCRGEVHLCLFRIDFQRLAQQAQLFVGGTDGIQLEMILQVREDELVHQGIVDVFAAQEAVALGVHHLLYAAFYTEQGGVESAAAEVEHQPEPVVLSGRHAIGHSRRYGLLDQLHMAETGQPRGLYGRRLLCGVELGGDGDDYRPAVVGACIGREGLDDFSRELLRGEVFLQHLAVIGHE